MYKLHLKHCFVNGHILRFFEQMNLFKNNIKKQTEKGNEASFPNEESITDFLALALSRVGGVVVEKIGKAYEKMHGCDFVIKYNEKTLSLQAKNTGTLMHEDIIEKMTNNQSQMKAVGADESKGYIFYYTRSNGKFSLLLLVRDKNGSNIDFYKNLVEGGNNNKSKEKDDGTWIEIISNGESLEIYKISLRK